jgi:hypothetical protein
MNVHYALQTCDIASNQVNKRFCCDTKQELIRKCVTSFFQSVHIAAKRERSFQHRVSIFDDHSTEETICFLQECVKIYTRENVRVELHNLETRGVMNSIRACYDWLLDNGTDLVYQVQDDYLFEKNAITEVIDTYFKILQETNTEAIVTPYNAPYLWSIIYKNSTTPRTIFLGEKRYWIQIYDISCSFLTSHKNFINNRDILNEFLNLDPKDPELEKISLNKMMVRRGHLAVCPFESIALHMQGEYERDPYVDWKLLWESIHEDIITR